MIIKYIERQKESDSCGPVSILNIMRWLGVNIPYTKNMINSFKFFGYGKKDNYGTDCTDYSKMLKFFGIKFIYKPIIKVTEVEKALQDGHCVVLLTTWVKKGTERMCSWNHFFFLNEINKKYFKGYNLFTSGCRNMDKKRLQKTFDEIDRLPKHPLNERRGWIILKENKQSDHENVIDFIRKSIKC